MQYSNTVPMLTTKEKHDILIRNSGPRWDALCTEIKAARNGQYPPDWYEQVISPGKIFFPKENPSDEKPVDTNPSDEKPTNTNPTETKHVEDNN